MDISITELEEDNIDESLDSIKGFYSIYTLQEIPSFEFCLDIAYSGYFKNKNQKAESNQSINLVKKIKKCEDSLEFIPPGTLGTTNTLNPQEDNFNVTAVKMCSDILLIRMLNLHGPNFKDIKLCCYHKSLSHITYEELGTLKATCIQDPADEYPDNNKEKNLTHPPPRPPLTPSTGCI